MSFIRTKTSFRFGSGADALVVPHEYIGSVPDWVLADDNFMLGLKTGDITMVGDAPVTAVDKAAFEAAVKSAVEERMASLYKPTPVDVVLPDTTKIKADKKTSKDATDVDTKQPAADEAATV